MSQDIFRGINHSKRRRKCEKRTGSKCRRPQLCCHAGVQNSGEKHCFYRHGCARRAERGARTLPTKNNFLLFLAVSLRKKLSFLQILI